MNCKQGDLAIIVEGKYSGKIVQCLEYLGKYNWKEGEFETWKIDVELISYGRKINIMIDDWLRPIRDSDKEDEMLSIINLKEKVIYEPPNEF